MGELTIAIIRVYNGTLCVPTILTTVTAPASAAWQMAVLRRRSTLVGRAIERACALELSS